MNKIRGFMELIRDKKMPNKATNEETGNETTQIEKNSTIKDIFYIIKIWLILSSSNGIPQFARIESLGLRFVYGVCILASTSYMSYLSIQAIQQYYSYQINISSQLNFESPTYFPAVDICNLSPFATNVSNEFVSKLIQSKKVNLISDQEAVSFADNYYYQVSTYFQYYSSEERINMSNYSPSLKDMLISCKFQGKICSTSDFIPIENFYYGNCYRFNGGTSQFGKSVNIKKSTQPGPQYGLQLEIDLGDPNSTLFFSYKRGLRVIVHNQSDIAIFPEENGINIPTGFYTDVSVSRAFNYQLKEPFNYCLDGFNDPSITPNDFLSLMNQRFGPNGYNQKYCLKLCMQKYLNDNCDCTDLSLPFYTNNTIFCLNQNQTNCIAKTKTLFFDTEANDNCQNLCPIDCSINIIDTSISIVNFPTKWFYKKLILSNNESIPNIDFSNRFLALNVFYKDLSYTEITQSASTTLNDLLCNIGNILGLCVGISFLSFYEVFELAFHFIGYFTAKNKKGFLIKYNYFRNT